MADPFYELMALDEKFRAKEKYSNSEARSVSSYIVFYCHDEKYAVALKEVIEIIPHVQCGALPGVKPWLKGLVHFRGDFLPVTDLQHFISQRANDFSNKNRVLVIQNKEDKFGLLVNRVVGIKPIMDKEIKPLQLSIHSSMQDFVQNQITLGNEQLPVFEVEKLLSNQRFYQISDLALI